MIVAHFKGGFWDGREVELAELFPAFNVIPPVDTTPPVDGHVSVEAVRPVEVYHPHERWVYGGVRHAIYHIVR